MSWSLWVGVVGLCSLILGIVLLVLSRVGSDSKEPCLDPDTMRWLHKHRMLDTARVESLRVVADGLAHDLDNLLMTVSAAAELLEMENQLPSSALDHLQDIYTAVQQSRGMTQQLRTLARKHTHQRWHQPLGQVLNESAMLAHQRNDIRLQLNVARDLPELFIDRGLLLRLCNNLVLNAMQSMPEGGLLKILAEPDADMVHLVVQDEGCGIPESQMRQIFDPYFTTKKEGSGLGLAVVRAAVRENGGRLQVESHPGQGTAMHVWLPRLLDDIAGDPSPKRERRHPTIRPGGTCI